MFFPANRPRRLRKNENFRRMVRETRLSVDDLVFPLFVTAGKNVKKPIGAMPGNYQMSVDHIVKEVKTTKDLGIPAILLFGLPAKKDERGSGAYARDGIIQRTVSEIKEKVPDILVITDLCLCEYTSHGHCGMIKKSEVDNDTTLDVLAETAVSQARAGADMVAPSAMMDGQVQAVLCQPVCQGAGIFGHCPQIEIDIILAAAQLRQAAAALHGNGKHFLKAGFFHPISLVES